MGKEAGVRKTSQIFATVPLQQIMGEEDAWKFIK